MKTIQAAQGKWRGILKYFGLPEESLRNRHQPCPLCGGNDRYRFDDKDGTGSYYCSGCGAGFGMDLLMKFTGMDFKEAARRVDEIVGNVQAEKTCLKPDPSHRIRRILSGCVELTKGDPVSKYLASRHLVRSAALLYHPALNYYENGKRAGKFPAMVARVTNPSGEIVMLHLTYLDREGGKADVSQPKKFTGAAGDTAGSYIQLTKVYERIGIAEGIETALAVMKLYRMPCWASGTADLMEKFRPPQGVEMVTVFADHDANYRGHAAAYRLANRIIEIDKKISVVEVPEIVGDYADALLQLTHNNQSDQP